MEPLIEYLSGFVTKQKFNKLQSVLQERTRYITVVLEDIYHPHNSSAVLRSCDCFGIQDVTIIEQENPHQLISEVELGSAQWLTINHFKEHPDPLATAIHSLKSNGYRIVATTPHHKEVPLHKFNLKPGKVALFFGAERRGLSENMLQMANEFLTIPMFGFTGSFNISVSAAIILNQLVSDLKDSDIPWQLNKIEQSDVLLQWMRNSIKKCDLLEKIFFEMQHQKPK